MTRNKLSVSLSYTYRYLLVVFISIYILFHILHQLVNYDVGVHTTDGFITFIEKLINGEIKTQNYDKTIVLFGENDTEKAIGPAFLQTITLAIASLLLSFLFALALNMTIVLSQSRLNRLTRGVREILETISGIPTIVLALIVYVFLHDDTPYSVLLLILAFGNNIYYEFSSEQHMELKKILNMDFVIAAQAWGDDTWKHIRRSTLLLSIVQISSMWIEVLANTLIIEIIFQKQGLGSIIYENIFAGDRGTLLIEVNLLFIISMVIVIAVMIWNITKDSLVYYLTEIRR